MSLDIFGVLGKGKDLILWIYDRIEKLGISDNKVIRIKENLKYMQQTIEKIEPHIKNEDDTKEITEFITYLQNAYESCTNISEKNIMVKFAIAPTILNQLDHIEAQIKITNSKLALFIASNNLTILCDTAEHQQEMFRRSVILQENSRAGIKIVEDNTVRRPPPPPEFTIQECKNTFLLSWKPSGGTIDGYEVCYDEHEDYTYPVGKVTSIEIGSPRISPKIKSLYTMKVRGVNKGGPGEWSKVAVAQFTKPLPQKPDISKIVLRSTMGFITVKIPEPICSTESPVISIEISYVSATSTKWCNCEFQVEPNIHTFTIKELCPDSKYNFRVKSRNTEGWSKHSDLKEGSTFPLPPIPARPDRPIVKICTKSAVDIGVKMPENTCSIKSPIIAWNVKGQSTGLYKALDPQEINEYYEPDESMEIIVLYLWKI